MTYGMGGHPDKTLNTILQELYEEEQYLECEDVVGITLNVKLENQQPLPEFVIVYKKMFLVGNKKNTRKQIQLWKDNESFKYVLRAASLRYSNKNGKSGHAVAGLFCDDEYYIFDSTNILLRMDWTRPNHSEYINIVKEKKNTEFIYNHADYSIYVKED
jgi:hypothetical protein